MAKFEDIAGQTFADGKVLAVKRVADHIKPSGQPVVRYLCLCECGNTFIASKDNLVRGHTTTCGCSRKKRKSSGMKYCAYNPDGVNCNALKCRYCGWNPFNKELRRKRIMQITRKDGKDE